MKNHLFFKQLIADKEYQNFTDIDSDADFVIRYIYDNPHEFSQVLTKELYYYDSMFWALAAAAWVAIPDICKQVIDYRSNTEHSYSDLAGKLFDFMIKTPNAHTFFPYLDLGKNCHTSDIKNMLPNVKDAYLSQLMGPKKYLLDIPGFFALSNQEKIQIISELANNSIIDDRLLKAYSHDMLSTTISDYYNYQMTPSMFDNISSNSLRCMPHPSLPIEDRVRFFLRSGENLSTPFLLYFFDHDIDKEKLMHLDKQDLYYFPYNILLNVLKAPLTYTELLEKTESMNAIIGTEHKPSVFELFNDYLGHYNNELDLIN